MFFRLLKGSLFRQKSKLLMIALTVALGVSLATAMLNVMLDVGDKVNHELKAYGSNITVTPRGASLLTELYGEQLSNAGFLREDELGKIKSIFWAFNIVDFAPHLNLNLKDKEGFAYKVVGTWFDKQMELSSGESFTTGMSRLKSWWSIDGQWLDDEDNTGILVGSSIAQVQKLKINDSFTLLDLQGNTHSFTIKGIINAGGPEDEELFVTLKAAQELGELNNAISSIEVSALTTPDNELAIKAAQNPQSLSLSEMETWYCTAYVSSICYQLEEVLSDAVAKPVRAVAQSEGAILDKTELLMLLITILSMLGSALGICNLVTAAVMERSQEIGLLKAIGAHSYQVILLILANISIISFIGGLCGYFVGIGFAQIIGQSVFSSAIETNTMVIPLISVLIIVVILLGSLPAMRMLLNLRPATVLRGGH